MEVAVRLRGKSGDYAFYLAGGQVGFDDFFKKIEFTWLLGRNSLVFFHFRI